MKNKHSAAAPPKAKATDLQAVKVAAFSASQKAKVTRKVASLAKARYKVAKKTYKITRKEAKRAAKEARRARKRLEACLALAATGKKKTPPAPKPAKKTVKRPVQRKAISKQPARKRRVPGSAVSVPATAVVSIPPASLPTPAADSID